MSTCYPPYINQDESKGSLTTHPGFSNSEGKESTLARSHYLKGESTRHSISTRASGPYPKPEAVGLPMHHNSQSTVAANFAVSTIRCSTKKKKHGNVDYLSAARNASAFIIFGGPWPLPGHWRSMCFRC